MTAMTTMLMDIDNTQQQVMMLMRSVEKEDNAFFVNLPAGTHATFLLLLAYSSNP
jgi:hypothetical protein